MDFESLFLSKVLTEGCVDDALDQRLSNDFFEDHLGAWKFILETYQEHGGVPPVELVKERFPTLDIVTTDTPLSLIIEELRKRWTHNIVAEGLKSQAKHLKAKDPIAALESMRETLVKADKGTKSSRDVDLVEDPRKRIDAYNNLVKDGGVTGLPTPWECLNDVTQGFHPEDLIMIAGRAKTGKTFGEVVLAVYHWSKGIRPLLFSREMSVEQIVRRIDAVHAQLPYQRFRSGQLTTKEYQRWDTALTDMKGSVPFWVSGDNDRDSGVTGIASKIRRYRPQIVYIDGGYLVHDDRGAKAPWERWSNVCWDLKRLAQREQIPIVLTHQFNLQGKGSDGTAETLKYGDVEMWFDLIIGMYQSEDLKTNKEMLFKVLRQREGVDIEWVTEWDLDNMCFGWKSTGVSDVETGTVPYDGLEEERVRY